VQQKALGVATTALALIVIARLTMAPMGDTVTGHLDICLPCGYAGWADFLLNISLFVPLGIGLRLMELRQRTALLIAVILTITIESLQYAVIPGRESDTSDIIANSLGGALGIALADWRRLLLTPSLAAAKRLGTGAAIIICLVAGVVQWALAPVFPHTVYFPQIAPDLPGLDQFHGDVLAATFDGSPIRIGRLSPEASEAMRDSLAAGDAVIAVTTRPAPGQPRMAPITDVHDQHRREIFFLARRGHDLVFRLSRRTEALGMHAPSVSLVEVFPSQFAIGDTVRARVTIGTAALTLDAAIGSGANERTARRRVGHGVWDYWRLLIPDTGPWATRQRAITALSLLLLFGPLGYWAGWAIGETRLGAIAMVVVPVGVSLAIIPWVVGAPAAPGGVWAATVIAVVVATGIGRWSAAGSDR
jgi:hypothetical protein